jgi:hypothetical protein
MGKPIIWNGANAKLINSGDLIDRNSNSLTNGGKANFTWTSHGLTVGGTADIGRPVYLIDATTLAFADADLAATAEVVGFIYAVLDANTVRLIFAGEIPTVGANFLEGGGSLVPGEVYFLSATTAGKVTATEPTTIGYVSKPLGVAVSTTEFCAFNMRGSVVGSANARTQITLANNATTTVQNVSLYDAGSIEGWVYIDAPTDIRFYVKAPFSKYGAAANYYISPSYVGDTPPAGYSMTVTAAGLIQITLPNIASFTSAVINFALNAPAVGTNFPLNLDSANLTNSGITGLTGTAATTALTSGSLKVGELKQVVRSTNVNLTSGLWTLIDSITLSSGLWSVSASSYWLRNGATISIFNVACAVMANGDSANYSAKYMYRSANQINTNAASTWDEMALPVSSFVVRSDGTSMYFGDGSTLLASSQILSLYIYTGSFSSGTPQGRGRLEAIRIA